MELEIERMRKKVCTTADAALFLYFLEKKGSLSKGIIRIPLLKKDLFFAGYGDLLLKMQQIYDLIGMPQRDREFRPLLAVAVEEEKRKKRERLWEQMRPESEQIPLSKAPVMVQVQTQFRQHGSMQGILQYQKQKACFCSALELLSMLEECLQEEAGDLSMRYSLIQEEVSATRERKVDMEKLLERDPVQVDLDAVLGYVKGKTVLVTGGGGSIGSEICHQLAGHGVGQLLIFDIYENNAYKIQKQLEWEYPDVTLQVLIGSVRDEHRLEQIFSTYHPDIVFHAAAHKHVPLMEDSPNEAIKNNVFGTLKTAEMASRFQAEKFILISTDKAVNPANVMGASKRICEMIIQMIGRTSRTKFAAVRFGNVLGSNGSVIPLFRKQIAHGGPVTVTHPDIIRYFMTIPEAVSLVLEAGAYAQNGQIFVLNMGKPIKIADLARHMIRLLGYEPDVDIPIRYTGLRPGEKLYEELLMQEEGMQTTENSRIFIGKPIPFDETVFQAELRELEQAASEESPKICSLVKKMVPEYQEKQEKKRDDRPSYTYAAGHG